MIPKIIHLCWLSGDPYPPLISSCIESWKNILPDFEIRIWNCQTFDINSSIWVKQAFENKKYAFAADYIRFYSLYHYGGIYLDADVEVLKSFNPLLCKEYIMGEEAGGDIEAAVIGSEKGASWVKDCLDYYKDRPFIKKDGGLDLRPVPLLVNSIVEKYNLQPLPYYYFSPKDYNIGKIDINNDNTYCIHHFDGKWVKDGLLPKFKRNIHRVIYSILGREGHNRLIHKIRPIIGH